jgi:hypothetical protein
MDRDYDVAMMLRAIRRFWWVAFLAPAIVLSVLTIRNVTADYKSSFSASVLLPGDTEIPGSAERPELMILDDIGPVVASDTFAQIVADAASLPANAVVGHLSATRHSRIVTIVASASNSARAQQIANAAASALPQAVNALMVAKGGQEATVLLLDQPAKPIRGDADKWRITALATVVALGIGCFLAVALDASLPRREFLAVPAPH